MNYLVKYDIKNGEWTLHMFDEMGDIITQRFRTIEKLIAEIKLDCLLRTNQIDLVK